MNPLQSIKNFFECIKMKRFVGRPLERQGSAFVLTMPSECTQKFAGDGKVIVSRGPDDCLILYNSPEWRTMRHNLNMIIADEKEKPSIKSYARILKAGAEKTKINFSYRNEFKIPCHLASFAEIKENVVFVINAGRLEVWTKEKLEEFKAKKEKTGETSKIKEIAESQVEKAPWNLSMPGIKLL